MRCSSNLQVDALQFHPVGRHSVGDNRRRSKQPSATDSGWRLPDKKVIGFLRLMTSCEGLLGKKKRNRGGLLSPQLLVPGPVSG